MPRTTWKLLFLLDSDVILFAGKPSRTLKMRHKSLQTIIYSKRYLLQVLFIMQKGRFLLVAYKAKFDEDAWHVGILADIPFFRLDAAGIRLGTDLGCNSVQNKFCYEN